MADVRAHVLPDAALVVDRDGKRPAPGSERDLLRPRAVQVDGDRGRARIRERPHRHLATGPASGDGRAVGGDGHGQRLTAELEAPVDRPRVRLTARRPIRRRSR